MATKLVHLYNIYNPCLPDAQANHTYSNHAMMEPRLKAYEWKQHMDRYLANLTGPPKATDHYTVEELEKMGMVGLYRREPVTKEKQEP